MHCRYELKNSVDSRQDLQTRTASLEGAHALMTQSLRTQHLSTGPTSLRAPKRTSSRLSVVQEVCRNLYNSPAVDYGPVRALLTPTLHVQGI